MSIAGTYRELLRNGPLTRLLLGEFVSSIGDWLYLVALVVLVYEQTQDPVILGIVGAARMLPYILLSIPAGVIADRFDRRMVLLVSDLARAACMVVMAALVALDGPLVAIAAVAILAACFSTFFYPAIGALVPSLVGDEREFGPGELGLGDPRQPRLDRGTGRRGPAPRDRRPGRRVPDQRRLVHGDRGRSCGRCRRAGRPRPSRPPRTQRRRRAGDPEARDPGRRPAGGARDASDPRPGRPGLDQPAAWSRAWSSWTPPPGSRSAASAS